MTNIYLVWKEVEPNPAIEVVDETTGDVDFIACFKREADLRALPPGEYTVQVGKRTKRSKVPTDYTTKRKPLVVNHDGTFGFV